MNAKTWFRSIVAVLCAGIVWVAPAATGDTLVLLNEEVHFDFDFSGSNGAGNEGWSPCKTGGILEGDDSNKDRGQQWWPNTFGTDMTNFRTGQGKMWVRYIGKHVPKPGQAVGNYFFYDGISALHGGSGNFDVPASGVESLYVSTDPFNCFKIIDGKMNPCEGAVVNHPEYYKNVGQKWRLQMRGPKCNNIAAMPDIVQGCPDVAKMYFPLTFHATFVLTKNTVETLDWSKIPPNWCVPALQSSQSSPRPSSPHQITMTAAGLNVRTTATGAYRLEMANSRGQIVMSRSVAGNASATLDTRSIPAGVYMVRIHATNAGNAQKVVVRHD